MQLALSSRVSLRPGVALVAASPHVGVARRPVAQGPYATIRGKLDDLRRLFDLLATEVELSHVIDGLAETMPAADVVALVGQLVEAGFVEVMHPAPLPRGRVVLVGSGALSATLAQRLSAGGTDVRAFPSSETAPREAIAQADLVVIALEGVTYEAIDRSAAPARELSRPVLFVTIEGDAAWLGPMTVPGASGGFSSARRTLLALTGDAGDEAARTLGLLGVDTVSAEAPALSGLLARAAAEVTAELRRLLDGQAAPVCVGHVVALREDGAVTYPVGVGEATGSDAAGRDLMLEVEIARARDCNLRERGERPPSTHVRTVGVIGGGTAGYLTALALRKKLPELDVTVIESSKIPVIGVGEATTALLNHFLHAYLDLDIVDFYERVRPTWKLGIRFEWGLPGGYFFNSPFQFGKLLEAVVHDGDINTNCLGSRLMSANTTPIVETRSGGYRCLLGEIPYAYHLDNRRFVRYLGEEARRAGVAYLDAVITEAVATADRSAIDHLRTDDGRELRFDLYVDCTGFRSLLMGKALGSAYTSFASSLFADTAVVADVPNRGLVRPYTVAETMDHGWCWNIPMEDEDHRGYVFSSAFASVEEAAAEMRAKNPGMGDHWTVKFRSGRHAEFWRGNCVAIGNSFAFVEPLQSTAIHMILIEIQKLVSSFPREAGLQRFQPLVNREINEVWDTLRWFLAAHYRFNRKLDTPFWRECLESADVSGIREILDLYQERAPIGATAHRFRELDLSTFGAYRYDLLLMGMGVPTTLATPDDDAVTWRRASQAAAELTARALPHLPALDVIRKDPDVLRRHAAELARI